MKWELCVNRCKCKMSQSFPQCWYHDVNLTGPSHFYYLNLWLSLSAFKDTRYKTHPLCVNPGVPFWTREKTHKLCARWQASSSGMRADTWHVNVRKLTQCKWLANYTVTPSTTYIAPLGYSRGAFQIALLVLSSSTPGERLNGPLQISNGSPWENDLASTSLYGLKIELTGLVNSGQLVLWPTCVQ